MSTRFVNIDRTTPMLLPPDLRDWVQRDDLVHFLVDALPLLDLSVASVNTRGTGSEQYPPAMMLGLLTYCYANGQFSSRQIERATYQHLSVRYLAANTHPDHDTIAKFRRENGALLRSVFVQLLQLARQAGLLKLGVLALDGTKLQASATKRKTLTAAQVEAELQQLDQRVTELLQQAETADQRGEAGEVLPAELADAQQRRARLQQAKAELEEQAQSRHAQREAQARERPPGDKPRRVEPTPRPTDTINPTDPDSTLTPTAHQRYLQGYNAQLVVSTEGLSLIVAADVVRDTNDSQQLQPMLTRAVANTGRAPEHLLVDTGYENIRQIMAVEEQWGTQILCPPAANAQAGTGVATRSRWGRRRKAKREELRARLQTAQSRALYALRRITVEPAIGIIKSTLGFVRFRLRGLAKVKTEWCLVSLAFNCRRLAASWG
jgi:transposase